MKKFGGEGGLIRMNHFQLKKSGLYFPWDCQVFTGFRALPFHLWLPLPLKSQHGYYSELYHPNNIPTWIA